MQFHFIFFRVVYLLTFVISGCASFDGRTNPMKSNKSPTKNHLHQPHTVKKQSVKTQHEKKKQTPNIRFPKTYHATGLLTLPYDGIMEPFEIWYAEEYMMSRIDYYYGVDKTFQRGDLGKYGIYIKEIPVHKTKVGHLTKHSKSYWYELGGKHNVVKAQSIVPMDLSNFKVIGEEYRSGTLTIKLKRYVMTGTLNNSYTLWVSKTKPHRPIRYETEGFDLLLVGYYDHYYLDYISFHAWEFDFQVMQIPQGSWYHNASFTTHSRYIVNPMSEFVHEPHEFSKHNDELEDAFMDFKRKHRKSYRDEKEHAGRRNVYRHNARFIRSKNRAKLNYTLGLNHLADLTPDEFRQMNDLLERPDEGIPYFLDDQFPKRGQVPIVDYAVSNQTFPENLDWREYGVLTPVRGQSLCGSCWAFSTVGMLEGAYKIATGKDIQLSAQMLLDCTYGFKNYGCRGGWPWKAMQWVIRNGIATKDSYGRYLAEEGLCHCGRKENCTIIHPTSFGDILTANETAMIMNVATYGPVSVGINSTPKSFKFYRHGIYDDRNCDKKTQHSVVLVGYGKKGSAKYWIIKNSWSPYWGQKGYMKISRDDDVCGILSGNGVVANFRKDSKGFPFERMKKVVTPYKGGVEGHTKDDAFKPIFESLPFN